MRKQEQGFTLIELMIVVAIIAILAAIAIPLYLNYTNRAKLSEAINMMSPAKTAVAAYYSANGTMPSNNASAGLSAATSYTGKAVAKVAVSAGGLITATTTSGTNSNLPTNAQGKTIILSPVTNAGSIQWVCREGTTPPSYLPANCRNP